MQDKNIKTGQVHISTPAASCGNGSVFPCIRWAAGNSWCGEVRGAGGEDSEANLGARTWRFQFPGSAEDVFFHFLINPPLASWEYFEIFHIEIFCHSNKKTVFKQGSQERFQRKVPKLSQETSKARFPDAKVPKQGLQTRDPQNMSIAKWDSKARVSTACNLSVQSC